MISPPPSDFWQVGIVQAPIRAWLDAAQCPVPREQITWLPNGGEWSYLADPFAVKRGDSTHVFVEAFDYRTKHAVIEHHELGPKLEWRGKSVALARPFHLSYPFLVEDDGDVFMVPESHRAGDVSLYRALNFPGGWVREAVLLPSIAAAEPSLIRYQDRWWMFFTIVGANARDQRELHVASSPKLTGPWTLHRQNPLLDDRSGARPGGTPFIGPDGCVILPVQDCSQTYGGGLRFLRFTRLATDWIGLERIGSAFNGASVSATHRDGFHTLSACDDLTLIDAKRIARAWRRLGLDWRRRVKRVFS